MSTRHEVVEVAGGWAVMMTACRWIVELCTTKGAAGSALGAFERGERQVATKKDVWVVADTFVAEPVLGANELGEVGELDMRLFNVVLRLSQGEFDVLAEKYHKENGEYPW